MKAVKALVILSIFVISTAHAADGGVAHGKYVVTAGGGGGDPSGGGGAGTGGGGSEQSQGFIKDLPIDQQPSTLAEKAKDIPEKDPILSGDFSQVSAATACDYFSQAAYEGLRLVDIMLQVSPLHKAGAELSSASLDNFFPQFEIRESQTDFQIVGLKKVPKKELVYTLESGQTVVVTSALLRKLADDAAKMCRWPSNYKIVVDMSIVDGKGTPLMAQNDSTTRTIKFNPPEWSYAKIQEGFQCVSFRDKNRCAENVRRMIATHEILSLELNHSIEKDHTYWVSFAIMFLTVIPEHWTYANDFITLAADPGADPDHGLVTYAPRDYNGRNYSRSAIQQNIKRLLGMLDDLDLVNRILASEQESAQIMYIETQIRDAIKFLNLPPQ